MAPGGGVSSCKELVESWQKISRFDTTKTHDELEKSITCIGEKFRKCSIHELLECPICKRSMYPPFYQVNTTPIYFYDRGVHTSFHAESRLISWDTCHLLSAIGTR
uniref:Putative ovule protein n=1 Tax=Solanum chacoense TaxID=4108 RepID=A0A0V0GUV2_SOLCH